MLNLNNYNGLIFSVVQHMFSAFRELIPDIKHYIASFDDNLWYMLYRYDPEFRVYAESKEGIWLYRKKFTKRLQCGGNEHGLLVEWRLFNKLHRECDEHGQDQPARIYEDGTIIYYQNGKRHRDDDLPALIGPVGFYYNIDNKLCKNVDDSAVSYVEYCKNDLLHRSDDIDGNPQPAIIYHNELKKYFINGVQQFI